jgi:hypothetical protein
MTVSKLMTGMEATLETSYTLNMSLTVDSDRHDFSAKLGDI